MNNFNLKLLFFTIFIFIDTTVSSNEDWKCSKRFQKKMLELHNLERPKHGSPVIKLNNQLTKFAKSWTSQLAYRNKGLSRSEHEKENMGENLAGIFGGYDMNRCKSNYKILNQ